MHHQVIAGQLGSAVAAEPGDRAVDEPWVESSDRVVVEAEARRRDDRELPGCQHGAPDQRPAAAPSLGAGQVECDATLVAVDRQEVGALTLGGPGRAPPPGVVPARGLNLDHRRPEVAEQHRGIRTGEHAAEVRDDDTIQGSCNTHVRTITNTGSNFSPGGDPTGIARTSSPASAAEEAHARATHRRTSSWGIIDAPAQGLSLIHISEPGAVPGRVHDVRHAVCLSLIHISEPTRRTPISYAVFCLK